MLRYAWAYQDGGEGCAYPVQAISARMTKSMPAAVVNNTEKSVVIRSRIPVSRAVSGQLYIFAER